MHQSESNEMNNKNKHVNCFSEDSLGLDDAVGLRDKLLKKDVSPKELIEAAIARAQRADPEINAITSECFDYALNNAERLSKDSQSYFSGIPTFIKDNAPLSGLPTGHGSNAINAKADKRNGPYVRQFLSSGLISLGKSSLPEFGFNATTEPSHGEPTRNPWNTDYSTGASSGGSAALVAAGVVPIAHANDGGGSIRIPAACCGLVGLKPSRGRHVLSTQAKLLPINLIGEGVVTRSVRDTAYFHHEAEKYYQNPNFNPIGLITAPGKERLKIGVCVDSITGFATDQKTRDAVEKTARLLEAAGHNVEYTSIPIDESFIEDFSLYWASLAFSTMKTGKLVMDKSFNAKKVDNLTLGLAQLFQKNFYKMPFFISRLKKTQQECEKFHRFYDILLSPVLAHQTPELGYISANVHFDELFDRLMKYVSFTPLANASGCPAISIPASRNEDGLPIAIQLSADLGEEGKLIKLAYELEEMNPWPTQPASNI